MRKTINVRLKLSRKANKNLEGYMYINEINNKEAAINLILERLDLKADMKEWLEGDSDD